MILFIFYLLLEALLANGLSFEQETLQGRHNLFFQTEQPKYTYCLERILKYLKYGMAQIWLGSAFNVKTVLSYIRRGISLDIQQCFLYLYQAKGYCYNLYVLPQGTVLHYLFLWYKPLFLKMEQGTSLSKGALKRQNSRMRTILLLDK